MTRDSRPQADGGPARDEAHHLLSRRGLLSATALGVAGASGLALGSASPAAALTSYSKVGSAYLYYEGTGTRQSFSFDTTFHSICDSWMGGWAVTTPNSWDIPSELWTNGVYVNKPGMHGYGRAIDISRIYCPVNGSRTQVFDARYDIWGKWTEGSSKTLKRKRYWATVATLNRYFTYVLHYLYNAEHHNHVHVDNQVSGSGWGVFSTGRSSQVYSVQACLRYIWGYSTGIDGVWGPQTDSHSRDVLAKAGISGGLTTSTSNWRNFNHYAGRWGHGLQTSW